VFAIDRYTVRGEICAAAADHPAGGYCDETVDQSVPLIHGRGINKITWENACRFFSWDPFARTPREQATVGALRAKATDVDVLIRPRKEWTRLYAEKHLAKA
jgi:hypothetical protein